MKNKNSHFQLFGELFDATYYQKQASNLSEEMDLVNHYFNDGWRKFFNPSRKFDTRKYLEAYPDVVKQDICPLLHYIYQGVKEGRQKFDVIHNNPYELENPKFEEYEAIKYEFDTEYYTVTYADILKSGIDPIYHYIEWGWKERRNPSEQFNTQRYISQNEDVRRKNLNPFFHYITEGRAQKRKVFSVNQDAYSHWIEQYDFNENIDLDRYNAELHGLKNKTKFSILIPTYNTDISLFEETINSVRSQIYKDREICICDDGSTSEELLTFLDELEIKDENIHLVKHRKNKHISMASNSAFTLASGEWIVMLDHDDLLAPNALAELVKAINKYPDCSIIYSDEDKIDEKGNRYEPYFKPDWSYTQFLGSNYLNHISAFRRKLVEDVGGWRVGFEGSQDHDLLLRMIETVSENHIIHIPKILYHWRSTPNSVAANPNSKKYAHLAGKKALEEHFQRTGQNALVQQLEFPGLYRTNWKYDNEDLFVSVIIPTRNRVELLEETYASLKNHTDYKNIEILIVDNDSNEVDTIAFLRKVNRHKNTKVLKYPGEFNYSAINNYAAEHAKGAALLLLNNDVTSINRNWLTEMVAHIKRKNVGIVGAKLYYPDDTVQHAGVIAGIKGVAGHSHKHFKKNSTGYFGKLIIAQEFSAVTAACLLVKKDLYMDLGGLDENLFKVAFNDVDFCLRVRQAGFKIVFTPFAELYHHESKSRGADDTREKLQRFQLEINAMKQRWGDVLKLDPYYSPNLTLGAEDYSFKD